MIGHTDGVDEIRSLVYAAWQAGAPGIVGYLPEMRFAGVELPELPGQDKYWARLSTTVVEDGQATLSTCVKEVGGRKYTEVGVVYVQLFGPKNKDGVDYKLGKLAEVVQRALKGAKTNGGIWFRRARIVPLPSENLFNRKNVVSEYERDEIN